jgi:hypothetical protein
MKHSRPLTVSFVGLCALNVALQTKENDPLAKLPPAGPLSQIITAPSTSSAAMGVSTNMVTSARYELPQLWRQVILKMPQD